MKNNFFVIAGSSGGHILPAINLINQLNYKKNAIIFLTNLAGSDFVQHIKNPNCKVIILDQSSRFKLFLKQFFICMKFIHKNKKLKIIGFGGFITLIPILIGRISNVFFKKNIIYIHEQNIIYGLANKINYFFANFVFISFPKVKLSFKEIYVGNFFKDHKPNNHLINLSKKKRILLLGGSAGSIDLNKILIKYINKIPKSDIHNFEFDIQLPSIKQKEVRKQYNSSLKNINFFKFDININFKKYDLIISRSGSGSLFEILYNNNNVYFEPHMYSRDNHQKYNKLFFQNNMKILETVPEPNKLQLVPKFYFNYLINPFSINKIINYISK